MLNRRELLMSAGAALALAAVPARAASRPGLLALVYRGPASLPGCPEAVATLLRNSGLSFRTMFVGPKEKKTLTAATLAEAAVYAQPGGPSLSQAWPAMSPYADAIRQWVGGGGSYLGFCLGGYLAGATPGFNLLPGDTWRYITASNATVRTAAPARIAVRWRGDTKTVYFQDGPAFRLAPGASVDLLATYEGGHPAALVARYGSGQVGVVGPHPEADQSWFKGGLDSTGAIHPELGYDLIETVMHRS